MTVIPFLLHRDRVAATSYPVDSPIDQPIHPIQISGLTVRYRNTEALRNIHLTVQPGRLVGIFGPNGAGKSTLLKAMVGLIPVTQGTVNFGHAALVEHRDRLAYVPQRAQVDWTYPATVWDVVMMGRVQKTGLFRSFSTVSRRLGMDALERVGMAAYRDRPIGQLSGGQQQRVFLARALTQQADVFCFDEPMAGIDQTTQSVIFTILRELAQSGKVVLVVNHDLGESISQFDDLILLNRHLIAAGDRPTVLTRDNMTRAYGGWVNFFSSVA